MPFVYEKRKKKKDKKKERKRFPYKKGGKYRARKLAKENEQEKER